MRSNYLFQRGTTASFETLTLNQVSRRRKSSGRDDASSIATVLFPSCEPPLDNSKINRRGTERSRLQQKLNPLNGLCQPPASSSSSASGPRSTAARVSFGIAAATKILQQHARQNPSPYRATQLLYPHLLMKSQGFAPIEPGSSSSCFDRGGETEATRAMADTAAYASYIHHLGQSSRTREGFSTGFRNSIPEKASVISPDIPNELSENPTDSIPIRSRLYEPFERLFNRYIERGFGDVQLLVHHSEAPAPAILLEHVMKHRMPCELLLCHSLLAIIHTPRSSKTSSLAAVDSLRYAAKLLKTCCTSLYALPWVKNLLIEALLQERCYSEAMEFLRDLQDCDLTPRLWQLLVEAASQGKMADSALLDRLLSVVSSDDALSGTWGEGGDVGSPPTALLAQAGKFVPIRRGGNDEGGAQPSTTTTCESSLWREIYEQEHGEDSIKAGKGMETVPTSSAEVLPEVPLSVLEVRPSKLVLLPPSEHLNGPGALTSAAAKLQTTKPGSLNAPGEVGNSSNEAELAISIKHSTNASPSGATVQSVRHWCVLSSAEMGYALEHYSNMSTTAVGDDRGNPYGFGCLYLYHDVESCLRGARSDKVGEADAPPSSESPTTQAEQQEAIATLLPSRGVVFGLNAKTAARLMLRAGIMFGGQASPLLALNILRRYVRTCRLLRLEAASLHARSRHEVDMARQWVQTVADGVRPTLKETEGKEISLRVRMKDRQWDTFPAAAAPHPKPFLTFFHILREARDVLPTSSDVLSTSSIADSAGAGRVDVHGDEGFQVNTVARGGKSSTSALPMMHWELAWHYFQLLNRENASWYVHFPQDAADLCLCVLELLCRGADPWMSLNVARWAAARHIADGVDVSLWLLHNLDLSHHAKESQDVTRKVFRWLLVDVGLHLQPHMHQHLLSIARVLIRINMQEELTALYNAVLDNVYAFSEDFRGAFIQVMSDLVCPACSSILASQAVFEERVCPNCLAAIPAKDPRTSPSYQLTEEHVQWIRKRRQESRQRSRRHLLEGVDHLPSQSGLPSSSPAAVLGSTTDAVLAPPVDAAVRFQRKVLTDAPPLLPGVSIPSEMVLFPQMGEGAGGFFAAASPSSALAASPPFDLRGAMEESTRRLRLQRAARAYALAQRGINDSNDDHDHHHSENRHQHGMERGIVASPQAARPSPLGVSIAGGDAMGGVALGGAWVCVWCQETNSEWGSRVACGACGAETGPAAPWRQFTPPNSGDVMSKLRACIAEATGGASRSAIVAGYMLMVYRRTFALRATPQDHKEILQLVARLCAIHERVLAAYTYTRMVPSAARHKDDACLHMLAQLFGGSKSLKEIPPEDLQDDEKFFQTVFTPDTCKVCFGLHSWKMCPILTRDFSSTHKASINVSPEEKQNMMIQHLQRAVQKALQHGKEQPNLVVDAYTSFVTSSFRERFAETNPHEANQLSILLSDFRQYRRAALVLCHVPLHLRANAAYLRFLHYFNVTEEEATHLLSKRHPDGAPDDSHPNFVQVTMTCCICLDQRHASSSCPMLGKWLEEVRQGHFSSRERSGERLQAQVEGWTAAGPERLHTFHSFLLERVDDLFPRDTLPPRLFQTSENSSGRDQRQTSGRKGGTNGALQQEQRDRVPLLYYAVNRCITKLVSVGLLSYAYRLYARVPTQWVSHETTIALLRANSFTEKGISTLIAVDNDGAASEGAKKHTAGNLMSGVISEAARNAAVPLLECCLICFNRHHAFWDCPELAAQATLAGKLQFLVKHVGGIRSSKEGISAAAAYVYYLYNKGLLSNDVFHNRPSIARDLLTLVSRCFASKQIASGMRVLQRVPLEMVPPERIYVLFWRAAGLDEDTIETRRMKLGDLYDSENFVPSIDSPPPRRAFSKRFLSNLTHVLYEGICEHCYEHGHTLESCPVLYAEVSFGRDYIAAYRMSMISEQLDHDWQDAYLLKLVDFFAAHRIAMPYHILGVTNALNAIASMWSFRGEPGIALKHLLRIPPAYRGRQAFKHILNCLQVPPAEVVRVLTGYYFPRDDVHETSSVDGLPARAATTHRFLIFKTPIRDAAMKAVFGNYPAAVAALEQADERMARIRRRNRVPGATPPPTLPSTTKEMKARLDMASFTDDSSVKAEKRTPLISSQDNSRLKYQEAPPHAPPSLQSVSLHESSAWSRDVTHESRLFYREMQSGDITRLREHFDPVLEELEDAVGMKLGTRHVLFTSAIDIVSDDSGDRTTSHNDRSDSTSPISGTATMRATISEGEIVNEIVLSPHKTHQVPSHTSSSASNESRHYDSRKMRFAPQERGSEHRDSERAAGAAQRPLYPPALSANRDEHRRRSSAHNQGRSRNSQSEHRPAYPQRSGGHRDNKGRYSG